MVSGSAHFPRFVGSDAPEGVVGQLKMSAVVQSVAVVALGNMSQKTTVESAPTSTGETRTSRWTDFRSMAPPPPGSPAVRRAWPGW